MEAFRKMESSSIHAPITHDAMIWIMLMLMSRANGKHDLLMRKVHSCMAYFKMASRFIKGFKSFYGKDDALFLEGMLYGLKQPAMGSGKSI